MVVLNQLLQVQAEGWMFNALSTGGSVAILAVGIWYFTKQLDQQQKRNEASTKELISRYETATKELTERYEERLNDMQIGLDKAYEKYAILTGMATDALTQVTKGQTELLTAIKELKNGR